MNPIEDIDSTKRDFLIKIAKMYYLEGLSQQEIADKVAASRSNISKVLKTCRDLKLVEIRINDTSSSGLLLQNEMKELFRLSQVIVVPTGDTPEATVLHLGRAAADLLQSLLDNGMSIGMSWGSSLYHMVRQFRSARQMDIEVIQLLGGTGACDLQTDGLELAKALAQKLGARCGVLEAPLIVQSKSLKDLLVQEPRISRVLKKAEEVDIALVGIGSNYYETSALVRAGFLSQEESQHLLARGVVGDVCGRQIDIDGNVCEIDINQRVIGIELDKLKRIPEVIGVAAGTQKAEAILGTLRGGYMNVLVTDEETSMKILSLHKET